MIWQAIRNFAIFQNLYRFLKAQAITDVFDELSIQYQVDFVYASLILTFI